MARSERRGTNKRGTARNAQQLRPQKPVPGNGLEFSNISYSVIKKQKKDGMWIKKEAYLLHDIFGQAIKGEIMAIMGLSGAGKSAFLDALAGRIAKGNLEGSILVMRVGEECQEGSDEGCQLAKTSLISHRFCFLTNLPLALILRALTV